MHPTTIAFRSDVIPIIYTGDESTGNYSMIEKCRGMFEIRMGSSEMVVSNIADLKKALLTALSERTKYVDIIKRYNSKNLEEEKEKVTILRKSIGLNRICDNDTDNMDQLYSLRQMIRSLTKEQILTDNLFKKEINELRNENERLRAEINELRNETDNKNSEMIKTIDNMHFIRKGLRRYLRL